MEGEFFPRGGRRRTDGGKKRWGAAIRTERGIHTHTQRERERERERERPSEINCPKLLRKIGLICCCFVLLSGSLLKG